MSLRIQIGFPPARERVEITLDRQGAEYIAEVMREEHGRSRDLGALRIAEAIEDAKR